MPGVDVLRAAACCLCALCAAGASASDFCPPLEPGRTPLVASEYSALGIARPALVKQFTAEGVAGFEPFKVEQQGEIWHVYGSSPPDVLDGAPAADICRATGEVLNVYRAR